MLNKIRNLLVSQGEMKFKSSACPLGKLYFILQAQVSKELA